MSGSSVLSAVYLWHAYVLPPCLKKKTNQQNQPRDLFPTWKIPCFQCAALPCDFLSCHQTCRTFLFCLFVLIALVQKEKRRDDPDWAAPNFSREQQYQWDGMCSQAGAAELRLQAQQVLYVLTLPQLQQAFMAIPLPKSKGTPLPFSDPLPRAGIVLGEETGAVGRDRGSAVALHGDAGCLLCWGLPWHCSPEAPEAGVATGRKEPADRQCLFLEGGCWEEGNAPCAENYVCKTAFGTEWSSLSPVWRSFPLWAMLALGFEVLVCWEVEMVWKKSDESVWFCFFPFRMLSVWIDGRYSIIWERWSETSLSLSTAGSRMFWCWWEFCPIPRAEAIFWGAGEWMLAQDYKYGKFYRLLNKGNLLCLKNKANQHPPDE